MSKETWDLYKDIWDNDEKQSFLEIIVQVAKDKVEFLKEHILFLKNKKNKELADYNENGAYISLIMFKYEDLEKALQDKLGELNYKLLEAEHFYNEKIGECRR